MQSYNKTGDNTKQTLQSCTDVYSERMETLEDQAEVNELVDDITVHHLFLKPRLEPVVQTSRSRYLSPTVTLEYSVTGSSALKSLTEKFPYMPSGSLLLKAASLKSEEEEIEQKANLEHVSFEIVDSETPIYTPLNETSTSKKRHLSIPYFESIKSSNSSPKLLTISSFDSDDEQLPIIGGEDSRVVPLIQMERNELNCACSTCRLF